MPQMPTREQYIDYALSLVGYYGAGAGGRENDVPFNTWYYGKHVSGENWSWCRVFECFVDNHFDMLAENGGKSSYVPANVHTGKIWHKPKYGSDAYQPCNKVNFDFNRTGEAEHTGYYWKARDTKSFWTIEGNTGNDQVAKRIRYFADVLDVMETVGFNGESSKDDDMAAPDYVSLGTQEPVPVKVGETSYVQWDVENSDQAKRSSDSKPTPGVFTAGSKGSVYDIRVILNGPATFEVCEMHKESDGSWTQVDGSTTGGLDLADKGNHVWVKLHPTGDGEVTVGVKCAVWDRS